MQTKLEIRHEIGETLNAFTWVLALLSDTYYVSEETFTQKIQRRTRHVNEAIKRHTRMLA